MTVVRSSSGVEADVARLCWGVAHAEASGLPWTAQGWLAEAHEDAAATPVLGGACEEGGRAHGRAARVVAGAPDAEAQGRRMWRRELAWKEEPA